MHPRGVDAAKARPGALQLKASAWEERGRKLRLLLTHWDPDLDPSRPQLALNCAMRGPNVALWLCLALRTGEAPPPALGAGAGAGAGVLELSSHKPPHPLPTNRVPGAGKCPELLSPRKRGRRGKARGTHRLGEGTSTDPGRLECLEGFLEKAALSWALKKLTF